MKETFTRAEVNAILQEMSVLSDIGRTFHDPVEYHHHVAEWHWREWKKRAPGDREGEKHIEAMRLHDNAFDAAWTHQESVRNNAGKGLVRQNMRRYRKAKLRAENASDQPRDRHPYKMADI